MNRESRRILIILLIQVIMIFAGIIKDVPWLTWYFSVWGIFWAGLFIYKGDE